MLYSSSTDRCRSLTAVMATVQPSDMQYISLHKFNAMHLWREVHMVSRFKQPYSSLWFNPSVCVVFTGNNGLQRENTIQVIYVQKSWLELEENKMVHRFYFIASRFHRMDLLTNNICWKCQAEPESFMQSGTLNAFSHFGK